MTTRPSTDFPENESAHPAGDANPEQRQPLAAAYFWLLAFFVIYCARPEDWVPFLSSIPLARIAAGFCFLSFVASIPNLSRNLPREVIYLILLVVQLWLTVPMSPVWKGGAFFTTLDFSKVLLIVLVMSVAVTTMARLRRLIFVQTASVAAIAAVTLVKGGTRLGRLEGAVHGIYENSNELALILVLTLPFCIVFLLRTPSWTRKAIWATAAGLMIYAILLTGSRAGLLAVLVCGAICLREFGIRGRKAALVGAVALASLLMLLFAGTTVRERFNDMFTDQPNTQEARAAHTSALKREAAFWKALDVTLEHPLFGIGPGNFNTASGTWLDPHNSYMQMSSEGGLPALILYVSLVLSALANLRKTNRLVTPDSEEALFAMALRGSLYGFMIGSFFSSAAYHFFPYFLVAYTSALLLIVSAKEGETKTAAQDQNKDQQEIDAQYPETIPSFAR